MKFLKFFILLLIILCNGCIFNNSQNPKTLNAYLSLTKISNSNVRFKVLVKNTNRSPIATLLRERIYDNITSQSTYLFLSINFQDSILMRGSHDGFPRWRPPEKNDYSILDTNRQKGIFFDIDFKELIIADSIFKKNRTNNTLYGTYTIQFFYIDRFKNHPLAIDTILSNKIYFDFRENQKKNIKIKQKMSYSTKFGQKKWW